MPETQTVPYRALVVDDEPGVCAVVVSQLTLAGWDAFAAHSCAEARNVLETAKTIEMVFVDVRLPDGNGMSLVDEIKARFDRPDVVVITGFSDEDTVVDALRKGVIDFIHKPLSSSAIAAALRRRSVRERERMGMVYDRFERVDRDFASVRTELAAMRVLLGRIAASPTTPTEQPAA